MTDERQMRFEEWADSEGVAQDLGDPERCGDGYMARDWDFLWRLWLARDAEVQTLREALERIVKIGGEEYRPDLRDNDSWKYMRMAWNEAAKIARAALTGGETGEAE